MGRNSLKVYVSENVFNVLLRSLFNVSFRLTNIFPQHVENITLLFSQFSVSLVNESFHLCYITNLTILLICIYDSSFQYILFLLITRKINELLNLLYPGRL